MSLVTLVFSMVPAPYIAEVMLSSGSVLRQAQRSRSRSPMTSGSSTDSDSAPFGFQQWVRAFLDTVGLPVDSFLNALDFPLVTRLRQSSEREV